MKQYNLGFSGLRSGLSPSARPFTIGSSSFSLSASESEHKVFDHSFLSSDDKRSGLDDDDYLLSLSRDVETTKGQLLEDKIAYSAKVLLNPNARSLKLPELLTKSFKVGGDHKLDMSCAKTTVLSEKSSTKSDQGHSEEDSPCWIGIHSVKTLDSDVKSVTSRRSTDDLSGFHRLNHLAPQFIPSNSKKNLYTDVNLCEDNSSSSLKKSLSSTFPLSSGEFLTDPPEDGRNYTARKTHILTHNADENFCFASRDSISNTVSFLDSRNEFQPSKRLDPSAKVFVPSTAKPCPSEDEKQGAFETHVYSTSVLTSSDNKSLNMVKVGTCSGEVDHNFRSHYDIHELGSTSSYNPGIESEVGITEYTKLRSSSNFGQRRLNPLASQFSLSDTKPKAYDYEKNQTAGADLAQSSLYVQYILPNNAHRNSLVISQKADSNFGSSTKLFAVEPKTTLSVKGNKDFKLPLPFHVVETAASSSSRNVKAPKLDVKKLLTTMHGLSELLTLAHDSESLVAENAEELDLINSTVQNLKLYSKNNIQGSKLPMANNMTVDCDVKKKEKCSVVSETVPDSRLCKYGATKDNNSFGQVVATNGYEEQISPHAMFYKSLWLKAEAERCLMVYETSLSNPNF